MTALAEQFVKRAAIRARAKALDATWHMRNRGRPRLLVYTDSRGLNVADGVMKHHIGSHVDELQRRYQVTHHVCPHKHTTVVDFLSLMDDLDASQFDAIVLHCGIVDFSPRPVSHIASLRQAKQGQPRFDRLFAANRDYHANPFETTFEGQPTTTLYSPAYLGELLEDLAALPNLIWVSSNRFVPGWEGNWKARPKNIDATVREFDTMMLDGLATPVSLRDWTYADVQAFTVDNIHFTRQGFLDVHERIEAVLAAVLLREPAPAPVA